MAETNHMNKKEISKILEEIGIILDLEGENPLLLSPLRVIIHGLPHNSVGYDRICFNPIDNRIFLSLYCL